MKLQYRLQLVINLVACLMLIDVSLLGYFQARSQMIDNITGRMDSIVNAQVYQIDGWLSNKAQLVGMVARSIENTSRSEYVPGAYLGVTGEKKGELYVAFADGRIVSDEEWTKPTSYDPRLRPWYQHAVHNKGVSFTPPFMATNNDFKITVVQAIKDEEEHVTGVVALDISTKELDKKIRTMNIDGIGYGVLISPDGVIFAHPNPNRINTNIWDYGNSTELASDMMKGDSQLVRYKNADTGEYKMMFHKTIPSTGWILGIIVPEELIYQSLESFRWRYIAINTAAVLLLMLTVFFISRQLTRPLVELTEWAQKLAQGELSFRPKVLKIAENSSEDEISKLAEAFAIMSANISLRENQRVLELETARCRLEQQNDELIKANHKLQELDGMKSDFIAALSHELRTPMTSMIGFTKIIKKKLSEVVFPQVQVKSSKVQKAIHQVDGNIDIIMIEGQRLTKLINDVLDVTKMEAGKMQYKMKALSIEHVMKRAAQNMRPFFDAPNKQLIVTIEDGLPLIMGDEDRLLQTLINLISNGEKFTSGGSITCKAVRKGQEILCSISDTGMGIAQFDREKIFDKFVQVGDTLTDKPQGTGLGLAICRQIIELHGGKIWVESELGQGSVFFFTLPIPKRM